MTTEVTRKYGADCPKIVVAMDIGSTYSGYAWQWREHFVNNRSNIEFNDNWGTAAFRLRKTTTCILLNKDKKVVSFGQRAEQQFFNEIDKADGANLSGKWYFFKRFKMVLYNQDKPDHLKIDDHFGELMPLLDVMSKFIGALKNHFLDMMKSKNVDLKNIRWVITVPAIWSVAARAFMRLAAEKSGISKKNLIIALEPEAAALHCIHLPSEQRLAMKNFGNKGDSFLTVDLGGGTTDVLAFQVRDDGKLDEICEGIGIILGGQDVNDAFFQACTNAFQESDWANVAHACNAVDLLEMENDFEGKKVQIGGDPQRDEHIYLNMPELFQTALRDEKIQLRDTTGDGHCFLVKKNKLSFHSKFIRETLFNTTIERILDILRTILQRQEVQSVQHIVLVGGFTESPIVVNKIQEFIKQAFPGKEVVVPTSPFTAVMSGAVLCGHDPDIFNSRIARATYGVSTNCDFDSTKHKASKRWIDKETGKEKCKDIFDVHVRKGCSVKLGDKQPERIYYPLKKNQTSIIFPIYMSTDESLSKTAYITDDNCKKVGEIEVHIPDTSNGTNRKVSVTMIYGGTELDVVAKNEVSGKEYQTTLTF